jgi:hypothetical protein
LWAEASPGLEANLAAKGSEARIVLVAQNERIIEKKRDTRIAVAPGAIEPFERRLGVFAQPVDLCDLVGRNARILVDQRPKRRIGRAPIATDLPCKGERDVPPHSGRLLLRGLERRLREKCDVQGEYELGK